MNDYKPKESDLIAVNAGAFNLAIQALKRAGKDEIAEQLEADCERVPDLIEQQQREIESLHSRANTWNRVWGELRNTQLIKDIGYEHAKHGNYSAASILLEAFETLTEQAEDEQTSLAEHDREVRARAVEDISCEAFNVYQREQCENGKSEFDHIRLQGAKSVVNWMAVWANKLRNGKGE